MKKRRKMRRIAGGRSGLAFCNCRKPDLLLQTNELMVKWIAWKADARIVRKYLFRKYNSFKCVFDLKIEESLDIQRNKRIWSVLEFSFVSNIAETVMANVEKKSKSFLVLNFCFAKSHLRGWDHIWTKSGRKVNHIVGKTWNAFVSKTTILSRKLATKKWKTKWASFSSYNMWRFSESLCNRISTWCSKFENMMHVEVVWKCWILVQKP